ncbi:MAG TPA: S8 family serine peptidase [Verrucomicrobiae bacterium]|nr:S8 family serine peptidase [Verrucomicrobiae bacterium]
MRITASLFLALNFLLSALLGQVLAQVQQPLPIIEGTNNHLAQAGLTRAEGQLIVKFRHGTPADALDGLNAVMGARILKFHPLSGLHRLGFPSTANLAQILAAFRNSSIVEEAGYNYILRAFSVPNDTYYQPYQWNFYNTAGGIWAEQAWDATAKKGQDVSVAIIDTGVAFENYGPFIQAPDLNKTFVFPRNFLTDDDHANDDNGHGTHVSGTIAQDTNNNLATAGIAYQAKIMPLKILGYDGSGSSDDLNEALYYAVTNGAKVINMSLGFLGTGSPDGSGQVCTEITGLNTALQYAYDHNVVVVAAAGNDGGNVVNCPAAYPTVIAVGATRYDGQRASYSTGGAALDIAAPGGDFVDQNGDGYDDGILQVTYCYDAETMALYYEILGVNLYTEFCSAFYSGTSMATPHVTGTVALILSEKPDATPDQVRTYLQSTARDYGTPGWDASYGWGLLNAGAALAAALGGGTPPPPPPPPPPPSGQIQGIVTDTNGAVISGAKVTAKVGTTTFTATTSSTGSYLFSNLPLGTYSLVATARSYSSQTKLVDLTSNAPNATVNFALAKKGRK